MPNPFNWLGLALSPRVSKLFAMNHPSHGTGPHGSRVFRLTALAHPSPSLPSTELAHHVAHFVRKAIRCFGRKILVAGQLEHCPPQLINFGKTPSGQSGVVLRPEVYRFYPAGCQTLNYRLLIADANRIGKRAQTWWKFQEDRRCDVAKSIEKLEVVAPTLFNNPAKILRSEDHVRQATHSHPRVRTVEVLRPNPDPLAAGSA